MNKRHKTAIAIFIRAPLLVAMTTFGCNKLGGKSNSSSSGSSGSGNPAPPPVARSTEGPELPQNVVGRWYSIEDKKWVTVTRTRIIRGPNTEDIFELVDHSDIGFIFERQKAATCENCDPSGNVIRLVPADGSMAKLMFQDNGEVVQNLIRYGIDNASVKGKVVKMGSGSLGLTGLGFTDRPYEMILQDPNDPTVANGANVNNDGTFQISEIKSGIYDLIVRENDVPDPLYKIKGVEIDGAADDIGIVTISSTDYNFKTEFLPQSDFLFDGSNYKAKFKVTNVGTATVKGVNYQLSTSEPSVILGDKKVGILNTVDPGQSAEVEVSFAVSGMEYVDEKLVTIDVLLGDVTGKKWNDRAYIDIYKVPVPINVSTLTSVSGLVVFKDRKLIPFSSTKDGGPAVVSVPFIRNYPYKVILSAATRAQEAVYSIGIKSPAATLQAFEGFFDTASYEPNDLETQATKVNLFDSIVSYLHVGDLDGFSFRFAPIEISYQGGSFVGANLPVDARKYLPGQPLSVLGGPSDLSRLGFVFRGWNTAMNGNGDRHWPNDSLVAPWTNLTLHAQWSGCDNGESCYNSIPGLANGTWATTPSGKSLTLSNGAWLDRGNPTRVLGLEGTDSWLTCGASRESNCYSGRGSNQLKLVGQATTPLGKTLIYVNGVWVESASGTRVLASDGLDHWANALDIIGRNYTANYLDKINVVGRVCPLNTYIPGNLLALVKCLYYDGGNIPQSLDSAGLSQSNLTSLGLGNWDVIGTGDGNLASWYEGNIKTCADKGMRLPTLYETNRSDPSSVYKPLFPGPEFDASNGVPPATQGSNTWTSSANTNSTGEYWTWSAINSASDYNFYANAVRCVSPAEGASRSIIYESNGGTGLAAIDHNRYVSGNLATILDASGLTRDGFVFAGWTIAANGSGTVFTPGQSILIGDNDVTLYAKWLVNLIYNGNGNTSGNPPFSPLRYSIGSTVEIAANNGNLFKPGFLFGGWTTRQDGTGSVYSSGSTLTINSSTTLYAKWSPALIYDGNGSVSGTPPAVPTNYIEGTSVTVLGNTGGLVKTDYGFAGWTSNQNGTGAFFAPGSTLTFNSSTTLYALWKPILSYDSNGGNSGFVPTNPASYSIGSSVQIEGNAGNLGRTGYVFAGWSTVPDGSGTVYNSDAFLILNSPIRLYAVWNPILTYESLGSTSGRVPSDPASYKQGSSVVVSSNTGNLEKTGFVFAGWARPDGSSISPGSSLILTTPLTLYPRWYVTLTYRVDGNNSTTSYPYGYSVTIAGKGNLVKPGYIFGGWMKGIMLFVPGERMTITSATTLTPWWYPE